MLDPGCAELHAARVIAWKTNRDVNRAEVYCAEKFASHYTAADLTGGASLAKQDPVAGYFLTLQRLRIDPENVGSHAIMCDVLGTLEGNRMAYGVEIMPDAAEQRQRELGVCALMMARLMDHPNEWSKALPPGMPATRQNLNNIYASFHALRGQALASMKRADEARACFKKALAIDPNNEMARKGLR
jgi:tetratricopeptide (TPR) repeat protein